MSRIVFLLLVIISSFFYTKAQVTPTHPPAKDTMQVVEIIHSDRLGFKKIDSLNELQLMVGRVLLKQDSTFFSGDSVVYNKHTKIVEAFGNIHINDKDSVNVYSQYLLYHVDTKIANLKKKVKLTDGKTTLYTEELEYDVNQKIGEYNNGGQVINGESVLTSKEGIYYTDLKDVYFRRNVVLKDPRYTLQSDSLLYNTSTEIATFITETLIVDSANRKIKTREGFYDTKNKRAFFGKRPVIIDGNVTITANEIETDDSSGVSKLRGNAVYKDSVEGLAVLANYIESNRQEGTFRATQHPLMIIKQENDSIYITADTLFSGRLSKLIAIKDTLATVNNTIVIDTNNEKNDSTDRYFEAYPHVRIFSDSLQAVSDSLFYSGKDSIFQLFKDPIVWASGNQVTGDTIYLYTKNKKAERLFVFENGLVINKAGENMFNQIKGNRLNGYFTEGVIDYLRAKGNAESVYYVKDDSDYVIGINKASGDIIDMRFSNKELQKVVFINDVKGTMYPVGQISDQDKLLRNFQWQEAKRPKSKFELFGD